jgi:transposase
MKSKNKFVTELSEQQITQLNDLIESDWNARTRQRAQAILLSHRRYAIDDISAILQYHRVTVSRWIDQWQERGLDGLLENEGRGRKKALSEAEEALVLEWLKDDDRSTQGRLAKIEKVFGKTISPATLRRLFKRHGKVWKRVRASLSEQRDEAAFRQCEQELIEHMEAAVKGEIELLYLDQSGFGRTPYIPYAWQDIGSTIRVPCRVGKRINVIGLYSLMQGTLIADITDKSLTSTHVIDFLDAFSKTVQKFTVVVLDNASIHTAKGVTEKLPEWERRNLFLYYLPTYSPELNIIEMVWKKIKYEWLPLSAYESFDSLWIKLNDMLPKIGVEYNIYFA